MCDASGANLHAMILPGIRETRFLGLGLEAEDANGASAGRAPRHLQDPGLPSWYLAEKCPGWLTMYRKPFVEKTPVEGSVDADVVQSTEAGPPCVS